MFDKIVKDLCLKDTTFHEVQIFATNVLIVNSNFVKPGKNLVVVSPKIVVNDKGYEWNLSGQNGKSTFINPKAKDGVLPGENGEHGINGSNGSSGGNVLIATDIFHNYENLIIKSNGGNGSDGQHGGDGKDGLDGEDGFGLSTNDFKHRFPPCSFFLGKKNRQGLDTNIKNIDCIEKSVKNDDAEYYKGLTKEGNDVVFSYYSSNNIFRLGYSLLGGDCQYRSGYCFVKGMNGTPGQKGGDGGCGGIAGKGAFPGLIEIKKNQGVELSLTVETENGSDGIYGNDGQCGKGGENGKRGLDNAWQETLYSKETKYHRGNLDNMYTYNKSQEGVWCNKHNQYLVIKNKSPPQVTSNDGGKVHQRKGTQTKEKILRQKSILEENVFTTYREIRVTNPFAAMNSNTAIIHDHCETASSLISNSLTEQCQIKQLVLNTESFATQPTWFESDESLPECCATININMTQQNDMCVPEQCSLVGYCSDTLRELISKVEDCAVAWLKEEQINHNQPIEIVLRGIITMNIKEAILDIKDIASKEEIDLYAKEKVKQFKVLLQKIDLNDKETQSLESGLLELHTIHTDDNTEYKLNEDQTSHQQRSDFKDISGSCKTKTSKSKINTNASKTSNKTLMELLDTIPNRFRSLLFKLTYLEDDKNITNLVQVISDSFRFEGCNISYADLHWLMIKVLVDDECYGIDEFIISFSASRQLYWLSQYLALQLKDLLHMSFEDEIQLARKIRNFASCDMVLFLSKELCDVHNVDEIQAKDITDILELSKGLKLTSIDIQFFKETHMTDWPIRLKTVCFLRRLPVKWTLEQMNEAVYCLLEIKNNYGTEITDMFTKTLIDFSYLNLEILMEVLNLLRSKKWKLSRNLVEVLNTKPQEEWLSIISPFFKCDHERDIQELFELIRTDSNTAYTEDELSRTEELVEKSIEASKGCSKILISSKAIHEYDEDDIGEWLNEFYCKVGTSRDLFINHNLAEIFAVVDQGLFIEHHFHFRETQKVAIILFLCSKNHGMLQQICTGEGKSLIIAAVAIFKVLSGQIVDIITSSSVLAIRDSDLNKGLFSLFDISVGHNCSDNQNERKASYVKCSVVYGEVGSFQRDLLMNDFYNEDIGIGSRSKGTVIVDEVDSMLLDKGQNVLYLSHDIPGLDSLESVYVGIWSFVHGDKLTGTQQDIQLVEDAMKNAMNLRLRKYDVQAILDKHNQRKLSVNQVWSMFIKSKIIGEGGEILSSTDLINNKIQMSTLVSAEIPDLVIQSILCKLKDLVRQGIDIKFPKFLRDFVNLHLKEWIENAFKAKSMEQNDHYIIDIDRSETNYLSAPNIIIMDKDTGVEQYHSQWSNGLHQFLQLKHRCRFTFESLKAVFMSNVTFFQSYNGKICGLTGTLGSAIERDLLKSLYNVDYVTIPSFRQTKFSELEAQVCISEGTWLGKVFDVVSKMVHLEKRPVLIICESVQAVEKMEKKFCNMQDVYVYKRSYEPLTLGNSDEIDHACILIATNLAGRGTDLTISERINEIGGLHVCLTYLPSNRRVEEQAFGRSARKGQNGSGQTIFLSFDQGFRDLHNENQMLIKIKIQRNLEEDRKICKIKKNYTDVIQVEEDLLYKFKCGYLELEQSLKKRNKDESDIILQNCLHEWAFKLDRIRHQMTKDNLIDDFLKLLLKMRNCAHSQNFTDILQISAQKIKLAKHFLSLRKCREANMLLDKIIEEDNESAEAHYYKGHCLAMNILENGRHLFLYHLQTAEKLFKTRCQQLSSFVSIVHFINSKYKTGRKSFLAANDYETQKTDIIMLYSTFVNSIQHICGQEVSPSSLEPFCINEIEKQIVFEELKYINIVNLSYIQTKKYEETLDMANETYQLYRLEIGKCLEKNKNAQVTPDLFKNALPSKEHLWQLMIECKLLVNENWYVVVDLIKLEQSCLQSSLKRKIINLKKCEDFSENLCDNNTEKQLQRWLCIYPEQLDDIIGKHTMVVTRTEFESNIGSVIYWQPLFDVFVLKHNSKGYFQYSNCVKIDKYDDLQEDSFTEIRGIDKDLSIEIFKDLKNKNVISDKGSSTTLLTDNISTLSGCLSKHLQFETEIINILRKNFAYRLAVKGLMYTGSIDLASNPHCLLFADLVEDGIVTPCKVNAILTKKNIDEKVNEVYGKALCKDNLSRICKLRENVDELWSELIEKKWLKCICSTGEKADIVLEHGGNLPNKLQKFESLQEFLKLYLLLFKKISEKKHGLCQCLYSFKSTMSEIEKIDSTLQDLHTFFDEDMIHQTSYELNVFSGNGLNHIFILSEAKSMWKTLFRAVAIGLIGVSQIALAAILELYSVGFGTMLANGLLSEGVGDIMFAIESIFKGQCTWETYYQHKKMSVSISVLTVGIGAYFTRGAKFSRYGYKIGGDFLTQMSGSTLIKQAGAKVVLQKVAWRASKKIFEAGVFAIANAGVDWIVQNKLDDCTKMLTTSISSVIDQTDITKGSLYTSLQEICSKIGTERAKLLIETTNKEIWQKSNPNNEFSIKITSQLLQLGGAITNGLGQATLKLQKSSSQLDNQKILSNIATVFDNVINVSSKSKLVFEIAQTADLFWNDLENQLRKECQNLNNIDASYSDTDCNVFCSNAISEWKVSLLHMLQEKLSNDVLCPIMQKYTKQLLVYTATVIKRSYRNFKANRLKKQFLELKLKLEESVTLLQDHETAFSTNSLFFDQIQTEYNAELIKLLQKTKDPNLFAEIIKEGIPVGIHCIQAITEIIGRPIEINTIGGDGTFAIPPRFVPSDENSSLEPVILNFYVGENGNVGHFVDPNNEVDIKHSGKYDCLFDAVNSQLSLSITREDAANMIETNPLICQRIRKGIHSHFINKEAVGGSATRAILIEVIRRYGPVCINYLQKIAVYVRSIVRQTRIPSLPPGNAMINVAKNEIVPIESALFRSVPTIELVETVSLPNTASLIKSFTSSVIEETVNSSKSRTSVCTDELAAAIGKTDIHSNLDYPSPKKLNSIILPQRDIDVLPLQSELSKSLINQTGSELDRYIPSPKVIENICQGSFSKGLSNLLRDSSKLHQGSIKPTGSDELLQIKYLKNWCQKSKNETKGYYKKSSYDILSLSNVLRVNTKFVNWKHVDCMGEESIQGHPGSLYKNIKLTKPSALTKGMVKFHADRSESALNAKGATAVLEKVVNSHIEETLSGEQLMKMKIKSPVYTTSGHNLAQHNDRIKHAIGIDRDREKLVRCARAINPDVKVNLKRSKLIKDDDAYIKEVNKRLENCKTIEEVGLIMSEPASCD